MTVRDCSALYEELIGEGYLDSLDCEFSSFLEKNGTCGPVFLLCAALASRQSRERHLCLDIKNPPERVKEFFAANENEIINQLKTSSSAGDGGGFTPLVFDGLRLYLRRHYLHETIIEKEIKERVEERLICDDLVLSRGLGALFPEDVSGDIWQKCAALNALTRGLSVITGGPGTGKTTVVVRVLLLALYEEKIRTGKIPSAVLCAPTGKAAAHMFRSVSKAVKRLEDESKKNKTVADILGAVRDHLPSEGMTIHRLLGGYGENTVYNSERRMPWDIVIVDECSMADAALFSRLISSVRRHSRVILLGDACQLSSVDAGSVMGDICDSGAERKYSAEYAKRAGLIAHVEIPAEMTGGNEGLSGSITYLINSRRFTQDSGIGTLASYINNGSGEKALELLKSGRSDCSLIAVNPKMKGDPLRNSGFVKVIKEILLKHYTAIYKNTAGSPDDFSKKLQSFQILCATRKGYCGSEALNEFSEELLIDEGFLSKRGRMYHGLPLIVTENDHAMKLYNGDTGVIFEHKGSLRAYFSGADGEGRSVIPLQISSWESAYALTVHKSQGSEYDHVLVFLPPDGSPILSRELLYTAVTRARESVIIAASEEVFLAGCSVKTRRDSGLNERLWKKI